MVSNEESPGTGPRVLVPRPGSGDDRFAQQLRRHGFQPLCWPVLHIRPLFGDADWRALAADLETRQDLIFVSRHAAARFVEALAAGKLVVSPRARLFAVGRSTAQVLAEAGLAVSYPREQPDSEGLLAFPELARMAGRHVLICRGEGGRDRLRRELTARGARVDYADLYRREPGDEYAGHINRELDRDRIAAVAIHSGDVLEALWQCLEPANRVRLAAMPVLVPGDRVARLARERGCRQVVVAPSALPDAMVDTLVDWYTQRRIGGD